MLRTSLIRLRFALTYRLKLLLPLLRESPLQWRVVRALQGEPVTVPGSGGTKLAGTFYRAPGSEPRPALLLLHGSTPAGRHLPLYRWLGTALSRRGWGVLALDHRGFGESDRIMDLSTPDALDFAGDVPWALDFLASRKGVDGEKLVLMGHSFGGSVAAAASARHDLHRPLVLFGPDRRYEERARVELDHFRLRYSQYMNLPGTISRELFRRSFGTLPLEKNMGVYRREGHPPVLLLDGAREDDADRRFLDALHSEMAEPKERSTLPGADHYATVTGLGRFLVVQEPVARAFEALLLEWMARQVEAA